MALIGRQKEKALIDKLLSSKKAEFVAVYGRRRVGKTFLIRQYLKNEMVFDFTGSIEEKNYIQLNNIFKRKQFMQLCRNCLMIMLKDIVMMMILKSR